MMQLRGFHYFLIELMLIKMGSSTLECSIDEDVFRITSLVLCTLILFTYISF